MYLTFCALDVAFSAEIQGRGEEFDILSLSHKCSGADATWLLYSAADGAIWDAATHAYQEHLLEERICAAEAKADQRREEERMCQSC